MTSSFRPPSEACDAIVTWNYCGFVDVACPFPVARSNHVLPKKRRTVAFPNGSTQTAAQDPPPQRGAPLGPGIGRIASEQAAAGRPKGEMPRPLTRTGMSKEERVTQKEL